MNEGAHLEEVHRELELARTPRDLNALLRAAAKQPNHDINDCRLCSAARDRVEDPATELHGRVEHDLSWHPPRNQRVSELHDRLRAQAKNFAHEVIDSTPVSREQSRALSSIDDALAQAIAAIDRYQPE
jgi:hypothetical protein